MGDEMGGQGGSLGAGRPAIGRCTAGGRAAASGGLHEHRRPPHAQDSASSEWRLSDAVPDTPAGEDPGEVGGERPLSHAG